MVVVVPGGLLENRVNDPCNSPERFAMDCFALSSTDDERGVNSIGTRFSPFGELTVEVN